MEKATMSARKTAKHVLPSTALPFSPLFVEDITALPPSRQLMVFQAAATAVALEAGVDFRSGRQIPTEALLRWVKYMATDAQRKAALAENVEAYAAQQRKGQREKMEKRHAREWHQLRARHEREDRDFGSGTKRQARRRSAKARR
jgi:hypothetical protein